VPEHTYLIKLAGTHATREQRERDGGPRPFLEERYPNREAYVTQVRQAGEQLARERYILDEDVDLVIAHAAEHYDVALAPVIKQIDVFSLVLRSQGAGWAHVARRCYFRW
jgi:hypothetical protein